MNGCPLSNSICRPAFILIVILCCNCIVNIVMQLTENLMRFYFNSRPYGVWANKSLRMEMDILNNSDQSCS
jgi:hypothetical protein